MNRLVIIGNGFDLAHGLPTGYGHFIDWYWGKVIDTDYRDDLISFEVKNKIVFNNIQSLNNIWEIFENIHGIDLHKDDKGFFIYESQISNGNIFRFQVYLLKFNNVFFGAINNVRSIKFWVDIENEYYKLLKDCLKDEDNTKVIKLNQEFEQIKKLLEKYLEEEINQKFDFKDCKQPSGLIQHFLIRSRHLELDNNNSYLKEFPKLDHSELIEFDNAVINANKSNTLRELINFDNTEKNLFVNFNYTLTLSYYINVFNQSSWQNTFANSQEIQIHGRLNNKNNPINFGFGDEMDDHYKLIENKDDNEYLKNIKSFQYLQNSNYKDLLDFIDGEKFQVYIMGHSCGLSDRILLNTIFEHEHCRSIKVFYHEKEGKDNYTDIVQNISRHFNKKKMMRDKIVNKSLCQPLPQNIRFAPK